MDLTIISMLMILSSTHRLMIVMCDVDVARLSVENCVADICHWMDVNELKLNHDKIEIILIYSKDHTRPFFSYFSMGNQRG